MKATEVGRAGALLFALSGPWFFACGDSGQPKDAGPKDGSMSLDAGKDSGGFIRRRDAQGATSDPVPMCNRFDPMPCGAGQQCRLVIRRAADAGQFLIYPGCIEGLDGRQLGAPCDPWGGQVQPYAADGLSDELYVDPCGAGLYCSADLTIRGHFTCQRSCESGKIQGQTEIVSCPSPTQYCTRSSSMATGLEEICRESDACDPSNPTSCGPGKGCFLRLADSGMSVLTLCLPVDPMPLADGSACQFLNDCNPGSSCWGPTLVPQSRLTASDFLCRRSCRATGSGSGQDGGDDDAGTGSSGGCGRGTSCVSFSGSGLNLPSVAASLGQCE
jgi:hypothetical protein